MKSAVRRVSCSLGVALLFVCTPDTVASAKRFVVGGPATSRVVVDQFGYTPDAVKTIVVRRPMVGFDAGEFPGEPDPGPSIEIHDESGNVVFSAPLIPWNAGGTHIASGDRVWWADISAFDADGVWRAVDPTTGDTSARFRIKSDPLTDAARVATRMYLYQRCNFEKLTEHVGAGWEDGASHPGDATLRWIVAPDTSPVRDLTGGWYDAGDYNKYVNAADDVIHELLSAFTVAPHLFGDDFGLPESGNGWPDILDEVRFELDWLSRMQNADGSVIHKVSVPNYSGDSPPSADTVTRYYSATTATATMSVAGAFAHAARVFRLLNDPDADAYADELETNALRAWNWVAANPAAWTEIYDNDGGLFTTTAAEDDLYSREANRMRAAFHLWRITGDATYKSFVDATVPTIHAMQWFTMIPYEFAWHDVLCDYATSTGATPAIRTQIMDTITFALERPEGVGRYTNADDAYQAFIEDGDVTWGSNRIRSHQGSNLALAVRYDIVTDPAARRIFRDATEGYVHAIHGVNPQGIAFLTNLASLGIDRSVNEMYHGWFADGTIWDNAETSAVGPPPGFLTGGPNQYYAPGQAGIVLEPPMNQPPLKSYRDWNADWPESSWQVTEPHIPYQSAYIRLLSDAAAMARADQCPPIGGIQDLDCDGTVGFGDIVSILGAWGPCGYPCATDLDGNGETGFGDLVLILAAWN